MGRTRKVAAESPLLSLEPLHKAAQRLARVLKRLRHARHFAVDVQRALQLQVIPRFHQLVDGQALFDALPQHIVHLTAAAQSEDQSQEEKLKRASMICMSFIVMSSSLLPAESISTDGRMQTGGTARCVMIRFSGLQMCWRRRGAAVQQGRAGRGCQAARSPRC